MIYTECTKLAMGVCFLAHKNQLDKGGTPYVFHSYHIAEQMTDEDSVVVALLHDVVEDSSITLDDLRLAGFGGAVVDAVDAITRRKDESYTEYICRVKRNDIARRVKIEDLEHNIDRSRLGEVSDNDITRATKYMRALKVLDGAAHVRHDRAW